MAIILLLHNGYNNPKKEVYMKCVVCGTKFNGIACPTCAQSKTQNEKSEAAEQLEREHDLEKKQGDWEKDRQELILNALKEHLVPIWVCGSIQGFGEENKLRRLNNDIVAKYVKQDRGMNMIDYGKCMPIKLLRRNINAILNTLDTSKSVVSIPYNFSGFLNGFMIIPTLDFPKENTNEGNPEKEIHIVYAHSLVFLHEYEIDGFLKIYENIFDKYPQLVKELEDEYIKEKQKEAEKEQQKKVFRFIKMLIILGIILGVIGAIGYGIYYLFG
jgi:hypothetical protein